MINTKRGSKDKQSKTQHKPHTISKVRTEMTKKRWTVFPTTQEQELALQPLKVLCEALGLEMIVVEAGRKSKPSSKQKS